MGGSWDCGEDGGADERLGVSVGYPLDAASLRESDIRDAELFGDVGHGLGPDEVVEGLAG